MSIICEGVETADQLEFIQMHGCLYYQGYYFSPPVTAQRLLEIVMENKLGQPSKPNSKVIYGNFHNKP